MGCQPHSAPRFVPRKDADTYGGTLRAREAVGSLWTWRTLQEGEKSHGQGQGGLFPTAPQRLEPLPTPCTPFSP